MTAVVFALVLLEAATLAAFFMQSHRHELRVNRLLELGQAERATPNPDIKALIALTENLCQRIQAPQQAVIDHTIQQTVTPEMLPAALLPDDDDGFWDNQPVTKEALADILAQAEVSPSG